MISCIALDDEPLALEVIESFCSRLADVELKKTFTSAADAAAYIRKHPVDLIFLDIQMPDINGIDFYKGLETAPLLILTTAFPEFAVEGFNINAVDFLLKPISFSRFEQSVKKARESYNLSRQSTQNENRYLMVRSEYSLVKIPYSEILYIETLDDYIKIHQEGKKMVLTIMSLKKAMDKLPPGEFIRVHRSFVVPMKRITGVRGKIIFLNEIEIPIGKNYEQDFFATWEKGGS